MTLLFHRATMAGNTKVETNEGVVTLGGTATSRCNETEGRYKLVRGCASRQRA